MTRVDLGALIETHQAHLWRYLRFLGCDDALADDLTQETFLTVIGGPFEAYSRGATSAFLRTTARNLYLKHARERSPQSLDEADAVWARYAEDDGGAAYREALRACVGALGDRDREALDWRYRSDSTTEESARTLGLEPEGFKTLLRRLKERLKECVERRLRREER